MESAARLVFEHARAAQYNDLINAAAAQYGVPAALIHAVIQQESGYDATARSPAGAQGLMQLMPDTARDRCQ